MSIAPSTSEPPLEPKLPVGRNDKLTDKPTENEHSDFVREAHSSEEISQPADFWNRSIMFTAIIAPFLGFVAGVYYSWTIGWMGWPFLVLIIATWCISCLLYTSDAADE